MSANQPPAELCRAGEVADELLATRRPQEAVEAYRALLAEAAGGVRADPLILAKSVLGLLIGLIHSNKVADAHQVWISQPPELTGYGIQMIEGGQTSTHDLIAYYLVGAYLHSLSVGDLDAASDAVDKLMGICVDYATQREPSAVPLMLNNWRRHLRELHGAVPAPKYQEAFGKAMDAWGQAVPEGGLYWPRPYRWVVDWL
jgi:hypothetical protein